LNFIIGLYTYLIFQRLGEMILSRRHEKILLKKGAKEFAPKQMPFMLLLHSAWFISLLAEYYLQGFPLIQTAGMLFKLGLILLLLGQLVRYISIWSLGQHWNIKILIIPGSRRIRRGIYKYIKHPNYFAVVLEFIAVPMLAGLWWTLIIFSLLNASMVYWRIKHEDRALSLLL